MECRRALLRVLKEAARTFLGGQWVYPKTWLPIGFYITYRLSDDTWSVQVRWLLGLNNQVEVPCTVLRLLADKFSKIIITVELIKFIKPYLSSFLLFSRTRLFHEERGPWLEYFSISRQLDCRLDLYTTCVKRWKGEKLNKNSKAVCSYAYTTCNQLWHDLFGFKKLCICK